MAWEESLVPITVEAAADLSAKQYYLGKITSTGVNVCSSQGEQADCVLYGKAAALGRAERCIIGGVAKVIAGAVIAKGAQITTGAAGKAETVGSGDWIFGRALEAAAADGDIIAVLVQPRDIAA